MKSKRIPITFALLLFLAWVPGGWAQQFGPWSAPVNLGPAINTTLYFEQGAAISKDGLSLYFHSNGPGGFGPPDIYVSQRPSVDEPWGPPQNLGSNINTPGVEASPMLSPDGHRLYFQSNRPGGLGGTDLYVSRRHNKRDDFGWQPAENLGSGVNTAAQEQQPGYSKTTPQGSPPCTLLPTGRGWAGAISTLVSFSRTKPLARPYWWQS